MKKIRFLRMWRYAEMTLRDESGKEVLSGTHNTRKPGECA